jgi:integral membrane protein
VTALPRATAASLTRFRILAWLVGVMLLVLVGVAMPVKYVGGDDSLVATVSPVHGLLYIVYLVATLDLARRVGWGPRQTVLVMLGGTVPFLSFVLERRVARRLPAPPAPARQPDTVPR